MKHILSVSMPRSGHHLLVRLLQSYYEDFFSYCDYYGVWNKNCCRKIPCTLVNALTNDNYIFMQKNHDFYLKSPVLKNYKYLVQFRHPVAKSVSNFKLYINKNKEQDTKTGFSCFLEKESNYYVNFYKKWIETKNQNAIVIKYENLVDENELTVRKIINFITDNDEFSIQKYAKASEQLLFINDNKDKFSSRKITDFPYFDLELIKSFEDKIFSNCPELPYKSYFAEDFNA